MTEYEFDPFREETSFRGILDPDMRLIWLQIRDCLKAYNEGDEIAFSNGVMGLLASIPYTKRMEIQAREDEYVTEETVWISVTVGGITLSGDPDNPVVINRRGIDYDYDPNFNGGQPKQISPIQRNIVTTEYYKLFTMIQKSFEEINLRWPKDAKNAEYGLYPKPQDIKPTPVSEEDVKKNLLQDHDSLHHRSWIIFEGRLVKVMNFRGYALGIGEGEKPWFFNELATRQTKQEPIVILITGTQGKGKTYCGIRLAEIFDKKFDPDKQIVMKRDEIMNLVSGQSGLKRDQAIIIDESQFGAGARSWGNKDQQILMNFLAAARFHGYIIIIVALHRSMLDKIIRNRILNYHIVMEERGVSTVYENRFNRFAETFYPKRRGTLILRLPDYDRCQATTCLTCKKRENCYTLRAIYEKKKEGFVTEEAIKVSKNKADKEERIKGRDYEAYADAITLEYHTLPSLKRNDRKDPEAIAHLLSQKLGKPISTYLAQKVRRIIELRINDTSTTGT